MYIRFLHYAARVADLLIDCWVPRQHRLPLQFQKHTLLLRWEPESRLLRRYAKRSTIAIDVGANRGLWSYAMAKSGLFKRILAFEPNPSLTGDLESMALPSVTVIHQAVSNFAGKCLLRIPRHNNQLLDGWASLEAQIDLATDDFEELVVDTICLDSLPLTDVGFIKIDVEGHEMSLLEGARKFFTKNRPICLVECRDRNQMQVEGYFSNLHLGYKRVDTLALFGFRLSVGNVLFAIR